jgi:hypothetical protein
VGGEKYLKNEEKEDAKGAKVTQKSQKRNSKKFNFDSLKFFEASTFFFCLFCVFCAAFANFASGIHEFGI